MENVLYRFQGDPDAAGPYNDLGFDQGGDLYGTSKFGGGGGSCYGDVPGCGTVYELTPSSSGWTEKILYSFTPETYAQKPSTLLVGNDDNLYGTTSGGGDYGYGYVYQLTPSENRWTKTNLYSFQVPQTDVIGQASSALVQDSYGNLYGIALQHNPGEYPSYGVIFMLSPSSGQWVYSVLRANDTGDIFTNLIMDAAGNLYGTGAPWSGCIPSTCFGYIFKLGHGIDGWQYSTPIYFNAEGFGESRGLALDSHGNLYGAAGCGKYGLGTVWQFSP
jgi:uncharacterized repeat protein (TIGR03803 family)